MKAIFFALAIFATANSLFGQVNFTTAPRQLQLYPRNLLTNKAQVPISGTVTTAGNKEIKVEMYRNNVLTDTKTQALSGSAGETFSFVDEIVSEMASYKFVISLKDAFDVYSVVGSADNVVAGDAIIIQGQSNAVAAQLDGSSASYSNNYVRVYGSANESFDANIVHQWYIGQGDGNENSAGNTGQWGLVLGDTIVKTTGRPIAIFNGGRGAQLIAYFQRNELNKTDLSSNYGRLLTRVQEAGFTNNIRAIMWYQGEANAANNQASFGFVKDYKPLFLQLINSWKEDYASVTNLYITQIRQGCVQPLDSTSVVQEAQRQVAVENSNYRIYGTGRLIHYMDDCHFPFANGYETLGKDWAAPLFEDLFGITAPANTTSPLVTNIQRTNGNQLVLTMQKSDNLTVPASALPNFIFQGVSTQPVITSTSFAGNGLTLTLDAFPAGTTGLTYAEANDNYVYNDRGLAMVHFFNQSISSLLPLRLVAFNAGFQNNTDVLLSWTSADESGIDSYKIQVSQDGSSFNTIGTIIATNGSGNQSYSFVDKNAGAKNYYRLQIVEKAGSANYSSLKLVTKQVGKLSLLVSPNPTAINPMVSINSPVAQDAQIIINNANGQRVTIFKKQLIAGANSFELNGSFLKTNGMYFVQLLTGDSFAQAKFIVAK